MTDTFALIRLAGTAAPNYDLDTDAIIKRLTDWQALSEFEIVSADSDSVDLIFTRLPTDLTAFAEELYDFCPDLVDQGTGCMEEMLEIMQESGEELSPMLAELIDGIDFSDEHYGVEILKRSLEQDTLLKLWWD